MKRWIVLLAVVVLVACATASTGGARPSTQDTVTDTLEFPISPTDTYTYAPSLECRVNRVQVLPAVVTVIRTCEV